MNTKKTPQSKRQKVYKLERLTGFRGGDELDLRLQF